MMTSNFSRWNRVVLCASSAVLGLLPVLMAGEAQAASITFTTIASSAPNQWGQSEFSSFGLGLGTAGGWSNYSLGFSANQYGISISNSGTVAFYAVQNGLPGIFTGLTGSTFDRKVIARTDGIYQSFGQGISINNKLSSTDKEDIAFFATLDNGQNGIYRVENGMTVSTNIVNTNGIFSSFLPGVSMNDTNTVAFLANLDSGGKEIFKSNGTTTTQITNCTNNNNLLECPLGSSPGNSPSINNSGTVAFASQNGVFTGDGGPVSIIVSDPDNFWNGSYREANINNSGWVSAFAHNAGPGQIIFSADGNDGSIIAGNDISPINGGDFWYVGTSSINNNGNVAFMAQQANGVKGIFTGHDAVKDKVIAVGDYLLNGAGNRLIDSPIVDLSFDRQSLNDSGSIAFWAKFANGVEGIYRSNPFGTSQFNPWMPNCQVNNGSIYSFCDVRSHQWYDPPTAYGFDYQMDGDSLFTSILDLPSTFENPFTVSVAGKVLGIFGNGDSLNFVDYANLLGDLLMTDSNGNKGVTKFTVRTGDAIDPTNPMVLPIKLGFNTETADFSLYALDPTSNPTAVPEPTTMLGMVTFGAFLLRAKSRRRQA